jgi:hypothetical protein
MDLARRFPTATLWWPAAGEDIRFEGIPSRPGKSVLLEVKTAEWDASKCQHRLTLDVEQLGAYQESRVPVYYVLPVPPWAGELSAGNPWLGTRRPSEILQPGSGWFGDWTFVVSAQELWRHLDGKKNRQAQKTASLFTHAMGSKGLEIVAPSLADWWTWEDFWARLSSCGSPTMPSLFSAPSTPYLGRRVSRQRLAESLANSAEPKAPSADAVGGQTRRLYGSVGNNDIYAELTEDDVERSLDHLNGWLQSTAVVQLPQPELNSEPR